MTKTAIMPIYDKKKNLKLFFSGTNELIAMALGM